MKAIIFAAGLGTRLFPLTKNKPKALVPYKGKPLLQIAIEKLVSSGFDDIIVNVHHFSKLVKDFIFENKFNAKITISDETQELLDTGGGLFFASEFFDDNPFLVYNVDIISEINLQNFYKSHIENKALATLAVQNRESDKKLYFDQNNYLCKWKNEISGEQKNSRFSENQMPYAFSGIHVIDPKIFSFMKAGKYSIIDTYLFAAKTEKISFFEHSNDFWRDMGKPQSFTN